MGANTKDGANLTGLILARRRRLSNDLLVKSSPNSASQDVFGDWLFDAAAGGATSIDCTVGNTVAAGTASTINAAVSIPTVTGNAAAAGTASQINSAVSIACAPGNTVAAGTTCTINASVNLSTVTGDAVAAGTAAQINAATSIATVTGNAVADGIPATLGGALVIACTVGDAVASGTVAGVNAATNIGTTTGNAVADGVTAGIELTGGAIDVKCYQAYCEPNAQPFDVKCYQAYCEPNAQPFDVKCYQAYCEPNSAVETPRRSKHLGRWQYQEAHIWAVGAKPKVFAGRARVEAVSASSPGVAVAMSVARPTVHTGMASTVAVRAEAHVALGSLLRAGVGAAEVLAVRSEASVALGSVLQTTAGLTSVSAGSSVMLVGTAIRPITGYPVVKTIRNPTDEEIIMYFTRRRGAARSQAWPNVKPLAPVPGQSKRPPATTMGMW